MVASPSSTGNGAPEDASFLDRLVCSPCCLPKKTRQELFPAYQKIGFKNYEAFPHWAASCHPWTGDPERDREEAAAFGFRITSYHLPPIGPDFEPGLADALAAARYASRLGDGVVVLFKASDREIFGRAAGPFLDALESEGLDVVPVVQNHVGSAITTLEDYRNVLERINDPRMKCILEVGHFQRIGVGWREAWDLLGDRIALIHVNDIREGNSVCMNTGEVDFPGLLDRMIATNYPGRMVVELELPGRMEDDPRETLEGLALAFDFLGREYTKRS